MESDPAAGAAAVIERTPAGDVELETRRLQLAIDGNVLTDFVMENGMVKSDSLFKIKLATIDQTPEVISFFVEEETKDGPYGAKGVGELASIPTTPAVINAIYHATGVRCYSLPADKKWLRQQLAQQE